MHELKQRKKKNNVVSYYVYNINYAVFHEDDDCD